MQLTSVCEITAVIDGTTNKAIVPNDIDSINSALDSMGIENTTGSDPSSDRRFLKKMLKKYKNLSDLFFENFYQDIETSELYVVISADEYNVKSVLRDIRQKEKRNHKKL